MWICFRCLYTFWRDPVAHSTNLVEIWYVLMWLPRLRFTLVPSTSSRSPFWTIFVKFLALTSSLVFVSIKLNGEHGNHLSPSLGEKPSWLMALPHHYHIASRDSVAFRSICLRPQTPLLPSRGEWVAAAPGPMPASAWTWGWGRWPSLGLLSRSLRGGGSWPSSPAGKTK